MEVQEQPGDSPPSITASTPSPSSKKSRRSLQKRVLSVPVPEKEGWKAKGGGEAAQPPPPSDSWAWRKYGQKPIKGSPHPRGYYRCSSSKGCPARKQVERSLADPSMFIITYTSDHNHPWPLPKNHHQQHRSPRTTAVASAVAAVVDPEEKFADLMAEEPALMMPDDLRWLTDVGTPCTSSPPSRAASDELLFGPMMGTEATALIAEDYGDKFRCGGGAVVDDEEEALFAGLGELPEFSVVFRRGFLDRQLLGGEEGNLWGLGAKESAAASWCGSTW